MLPFGGIVRYHMAEVNCAARELPLVRAGAKIRIHRAGLKRD